MKTNMKSIKSNKSVYYLCAIAFGVVINVVGGQLALLLRLPIYLDCIGTIFVGALLGPIAGLFPNLVGGLIMGCTTDIYSLFYMPVGMITGVMSGLIFNQKYMKGLWKILGTMLLTIPGTIVSSCITVLCFGGLTSSGSSLIIPLLQRIGFTEIASIFTVQVFTDYADRLIAVIIVSIVLSRMPFQLKAVFQKGE